MKMVSKIKIGYFADGPWAHHAFKKLITDPELEIAFICVRFNSADAVLMDYAKEHNIDLIRHANINSAEFIQNVKAYQCDLFISMSFNQIFRNEIINLPPFKSINCHAGKLPFYRGRNILNWALINDEKEFGITVHYVDEGIDTGDIILQKLYPITDNDTYGTLLYKAHLECADVLYEAVKLILKDEVRPVKQSDIHPVGFYCTERMIGDEIINWNQSSRELFNFIRAVTYPGPYARTFLNGNEVIIKKAEMIPDAPVYKCTPGQVVLKQNGYLIVKAEDSTIKITDWESPVNIRTGHRFKNFKS